MELLRGYLLNIIIIVGTLSRLWGQTVSNHRDHTFAQNMTSTKQVYTTEVSGDNSVGESVCSASIRTSANPRTPCKKSSMTVHACNSSIGGWKQADPKSSLASHFSLNNKFVSKH